jgi:hypothetical protein
LLKDTWVEGDREFFEALDPAAVPAGCCVCLARRRWLREPSLAETIEASR